MKDYSNYHGNLNYTDKLLRDGVKTFERSLITSPDAFTVVVNDEEKNVMLQSTAKYDERRILFKEGDIAWGDIVIYENEKWLITERPFFNKIHEKSHIKLCNNEMKFTYLTEGVFERDRYGNKIWIEEPTEVVTLFPCVIDSISNLNTKTTSGHQVNVPEGDSVVMIQYTEDELIQISNEFTMFDDNYRISGIDKSQTYKGEGVLILIITRIANNT
ncbi:hypothetical protein [Oceanobacillus sp. FSL H7-0719]|uniref:hypothetical protein n=1 Tax=Oceanobacillus sp. FSL H7-0719 TaxID=2954507 RepID=UPI00324A308C